MNIILKNSKIIALLLLLGQQCLLTNVRAQSGPGVTQSIVEKINKYNETLPGERLYIQFDRPYYSVGDTIWFKGYLTNSSLNYSTMSSRLYIDLINDNNKVVKHYIFPAALGGLALGNIYLDKQFIQEGNYTLRAYTNWMRNFSPEQYFYATFGITGENNQWLINSSATLTAGRIKVALKFTGINKQSASGRAMDVALYNDKKLVQRNNIQLSLAGELNLDANLPPDDQLKNLTIVTRDLKSNNTVTVPVNISGAPAVDVQFMPESGPLVELLPAHIGFKAIGQDGRGVNTKGAIIDKENNAEVSFETLHNGMGTFDFVPQPGEHYVAKITLMDGTTKTLELPAIKKSGTLLKVKNNPASDSLEVAVVATGDVASANGEYTIIGQSRGAVCYAVTFKLSKDYNKIAVPKNLFPTGVAHLTLFNTQSQPLNERAVFIDHKDKLNIAINTNGETYTPRDSIPLHITVKDDKGKPVVGSFSLAVTDDGQIKNTETDRSNIFSQLLLSADVKGYIEDPAYYFSADKDAARTLDNLLLTQGWVNYDWKALLGPSSSKPTFAAEPEFMIKGRVTNLLNKPIINSDITLLSTGRMRLYKDTITNNEGDFVFKNLPLITDSIAFVLQARKVKGKVINAGITIDDNDNSIPPVNLPDRPVPVPGYVNSDTAFTNYVNNSAAYHEALDNLKYGNNSHVLKSVDVKDRAIIKGSKNLNGAGNYDQIVTQQEIEKEGKASLLDLIEKKVNGFHEGYLHNDKNINFMLKEKRVRFVIDGIDLDRFYESTSGIPNEHYNYQKETLDYLSAEDITGIEVIYSSRFSALYNNRNLTTEELLAISPTGPTGSDIAYLEITTRSGNGPFVRKASGVYVYRPAPVSMPLQFYRPRYAVKQMTSDFKDLRSTIHWEPNIVTNKNGEAIVSFYAADLATSYTIRLQGSNLTGKVGYKTQTLTITNKR